MLQICMSFKTLVVYIMYRSSVLANAFYKQDFPFSSKIDIASFVGSSVISCRHYFAFLHSCNVVFINFVPNPVLLLFLFHIALKPDNPVS